jgi:uncharacterized protein (TIGR02246 family)
MRRSLPAIALLAVLFTAGCASTPPPAPDTRDADAKAIHDNEDAWNNDFVAKDVAKLQAHYTDDATLMAPGMPPTHGKEAIGKVLKEMVGDPALSLKFQATRVEVAKNGDFGYSEGTYTMSMTNPVTKKPMTDKGSYVTVYTKQADGAWKAISDIASSEAPPAPPAK